MLAPGNPDGRNYSRSDRVLFHILRYSTGYLSERGNDTRYERILWRDSFESCLRPS